MISVEEALERILAFVSRLEPERQPLPDALGQVLAEDAVAGFDIPPFDNTAMDGYAVRAADTVDASDSNPVRLQISGELAAGYLYEGEVAAGAAVAPVRLGYFRRLAVRRPIRFFLTACCQNVRTVAS